MFITAQGHHRHDTEADRWHDTMPTDFGELQVGQQRRSESDAQWFARMDRRANLVRTVYIGLALLCALSVALRHLGGAQ